MDSFARHRPFVGGTWASAEGIAGERAFKHRMNVDDDPRADEDLMTALAAGDVRALERLLDRHASWALNFAERMVGSRDDAHDIVQTAFVRVWKGATRWLPNARFRTWFYRVLYNLCMDHFRSRGQLTEMLDESIPDVQPSAEERLLGRDRNAQVRAALDALPARQRAAIVLCYYEERSQAEAAALLGISEGALESLLSRGRATLRNLVRDAYH